MQETHLMWLFRHSWAFFAAVALLPDSSFADLRPGTELRPQIDAFTFRMRYTDDSKLNGQALSSKDLSLWKKLLSAHRFSKSQETILTKMTCARSLANILYDPQGDSFEFVADASTLVVGKPKAVSRAQIPHDYALSGLFHEGGHFLLQGKQDIPYYIRQFRQRPDAAGKWATATDELFANLMAYSHLRHPSRSAVKATLYHYESRLPALFKTEFVKTPESAWRKTLENFRLEIEKAEGREADNDLDLDDFYLDLEDRD